MRGIITSIPFALLTVVCWGAYGPSLHHGKGGMDNNSWAQLLCVGLAYFLIAVVVPIYVLKSKGEQGEWNSRGVKWGLCAGACGALGALGIITALTNGGKPVYVMPIVFGCAPVVNTLVSIWMGKLFDRITPGFYLGIILVALGAAGVMNFKPDAAETPPPTQTLQQQDPITAVSYKAETDPPTAAEDAAEDEEKATNFLLIIGGILMTVLCWGTYGSLLHKSQHLMQGSRLRPFLCVGIAYFILAVIIPIAIMSKTGFPDTTLTTFSGWSFSMLAGVFGAVGALGIILSFTFGGKPVFVMPLVFGGAPIINTFISIMEMDSVGDISPLFYGSLTTVIIGAIVTLVTAPKPGKSGPPKQDSSDPPLWEENSGDFGSTPDPDDEYEPAQDDSGDDEVTIEAEESDSEASDDQDDTLREEAYDSEDDDLQIAEERDTPDEIPEPEEADSSEDTDEVD